MSERSDNVRLIDMLEAAERLVVLLERAKWSLMADLSFLVKPAYLWIIMKVLLDIKEDKAHLVMELLKDLRYVKATLLTDAKEQIFTDWHEVMGELKLIKAGKKRGRPISALLNEL